MTFPSRIFPLNALILLLLLVSCESKQDQQSKREKRIAKDKFFQESGTDTLKDLTNEMKDAETDLLRSFAAEDFPWQLFQQDLLQIAEDNQKPICVFVLESQQKRSQALVEMISKDPVLREQFGDNYVCALTDTHTNPELAIACYHFSLNSGVPIHFPYVVWISHEGNMITSLSVQSSDETKMKKALGNSFSMLADLWTRDQKYAVTNSREHSDLMQRRLKRLFEQPENDKNTSLNRRKLVTSGGRKIAALYNKHEQDLDGIGGLLPSSIISLLSRQAADLGTFQGTRELSRKAALGLAQSLISRGIHDDIEQNYFYSRRGASWELPTFIRTFPSQAQLASSFLVSGKLLQSDTLTQEGLLLLETLERDWAGEQTVQTSTPLEDQDQDGVFLFEESTLSKLLSPSQLKLARSYYQIMPEGNAYRFTQNNRRFRGLNLLSPRKSIQETATKVGLSVAEAKNELQQIRDIIANARKKNGKFFIESTMSASDWALLGEAQINRYRVTPSSENLAKIITTAELILKRYRNAEGKLTRFPNSGHAARGMDYANTSLLFLSLYQASFEQKWLEAGLQILDEAILTLGRDGFPLTESAQSDRILSLDIYDFAMVFSESSFGRFERAFTIASALTGKESYAKQRKFIWDSIGHRANIAPIVHTDLLSSCLLRTEPFLIVLAGEPSSDEYKKAHQALNEFHISEFAILRPLQGKQLSPVTDSASTSNSPVSFFLLRSDKELSVIAQSGNLSEFKKALENALSKKE